MAFTKSHASIIANMLSNEARELLRRKYLGMPVSNVAKAWLELRELSLIEYSQVQPAVPVLTTRGRKVALLI